MNRSAARAGHVPRIAILGTRGIPARYGGFETFAEHLATGLTQRGMDVTVYAEAESGSPMHDTIYNGVRVRHVPPWSLGRASVIAYDVQCLWNARKNYDLVYMLGYGAAWACWIPRLSGAIVWINLDGLEWARSKWGPLVRWYLRFMEVLSARVANRAIADAKAIQLRYQKLYPSGAPCSFIAYGAELPSEPICDAALVSMGLVSDGYLLVIARMEPENHVVEIIQGHELWGKGLPLVLVGDVHVHTAYCERLLRWASERVTFLGPIYDAALLHVLRRGARAYIHGHSVGGTNPSLLEGMASGCQVIAHDNPFNREVLGDAGAYFGTVQDLARELGELAGETPDLRRHKRDANIQRVREHYSWSQVTSDYASLILSDIGLDVPSGGASA
ncbi:MAG: hypothetical protein C0445_00535 [Polaromonas sp.]|nr:hypothetical protein [Polaromonas sp.]